MRPKFTPGISPGDVFNPHRAFHGVWIPQWLEERSEVSEKAKKLYAYLTFFAGSEGRAWPSYNTLAEKLHISRRYVIQLLHELSGHRLIKITHVSDPRKGNQSNTYEFLWHEWMQHESDRNFSLKVPEEQSPELPPTTPGEQKITRVDQLPPLVNSSSLAPGEPQFTTLVNHSSPKENKEKRINKYKHPKGAYSFAAKQKSSLAEPAYPFATSAGVEESQGKTHGILWQEWMRYSNAGACSLTAQEKQLVELPPVPPAEENVATAARVQGACSLLNCTSTAENQGRGIRNCERSSSACSSVSRQVESSPGPARHSAALVRKAWQVSRKLLIEFWDNCKIRQDLRVLFGYVSRALRDGYKEESIRAAFKRSLHQCHGHATDCGEFWEASSTVHRAEKLLKANGSMWQPTPPEERQRIRAEVSTALKAWKGEPV